MSKILGVHIPAESKNNIKNGALDFWQAVSSSTTTINTATTSSGYTADMFEYESAGSTVKNYSIVRSADVPSLPQSGFNSAFSYLFTMVTGIASPAATDIVQPMGYRMEGFDYERLHSKAVTFGFWFKSSLAGTYSFALRNQASNRSYVTTFNQGGANTWQFQSIAVTLDNTGTWLFDSGLAIEIEIAAYGGSNFQTSNLNTWQGGNFLVASTATNYQATTGATIRVAQMSMAEGALGLGATGFQRIGKDIQEELSMCQRYYEKSYAINSIPGTADTANCEVVGTQVGAAVGYVKSGITYLVRKRASAIPVFYNAVTGALGGAYRVRDAANVAITFDFAGERGVVQITGLTADTFYVNWTADARL